MKSLVTSSHRVQAFTLIEALIATMLLVIITGVMATIWQNAYRTSDRLRSILLAHQRARQAMDETEDILLQRSGAMPLMAQETAPGRMCPFKIGSWQSKVHMDMTSIDTNDQSLSESTVSTDANGDGDTNDSFAQRWIEDPPNGPGPADAYSPGQSVRTATIGNWGWDWGMGRKFIWHSDIVRFDRNRSYLDQSVSPVQPAISYANVDLGRGYLDDVGNTLTDSNWRAKIGRRFTANAVTDVNLNGPYRGITIVPWVHKDSAGVVRPTPWLGRTHVYRVESGPTFFKEPWASGAWMTQKTGDYGTTTSGSTMNGVAMDSGRPLEPDWGFVTAANWNPSAIDPAQGTPVPDYGSSVVDNAGTRWRCTAPSLMLWDSSLRGASRISGMVNSTGINDNPGTWSSDRLFRALQSRTFLNVKEYDPDARGNSSGSALAATQEYDQLSKILTTEISRFRVRSARLSGDWTNAPSNLAGRAAGGRWGSLTIPGWWNGFNNSNTNISDPAQPWVGTGNKIDGLTAGFPGATPSGEETAGHPSWVAVDIGAVGGLDRAHSLGFELVFTVVEVLR